MLLQMLLKALQERVMQHKIMLNIKYLWRMLADVLQMDLREYTKLMSTLKVVVAKVLVTTVMKGLKVCTIWIIIEI